VSLHLVKVLFSSSLDLGLFGIEFGTNHDEGFLRNPHLPLPRNKCLLPPCDLLLPHQELLIQLFGHHSCQYRHNRRRKRRRRRRRRRRGRKSSTQHEHRWSAKHQETKPGYHHK
jgi:hypothetical protein